MKKKCPSCELTQPRHATRCASCGRPLVIAEGSVVAGRYSIVRPIASGGMAVVYLAREIVGIEREVALKVVSVPADEDGTNAEALRNEAFLAGKISHPHIVTVFDYGEIEGKDRYLAMEYLRGRTLAEELALSGPLDYVRALRIMAQVLEALATIHKNGLVHRDLKPGNIFLIQGDGVSDFVKLLDFGICAPVRTGLKGLLYLGRSAGTPLYMSPEQIRGGQVDTRSDLYSLGAVLYEMLSGEPPFTSPDIYEAQLARVPVPLSIARRGTRIPTALDDLLMRLLAKDPEHRPSSATEVLNRFRQLLPSRSREQPSLGVRESAPLEDRSWFESEPRVLLVRTPEYIERKAESGAFNRFLDRARSGWGGLLWLLGEEGAGKSTLGSRFLEAAKGAGFWVAAVTPSSYGSVMGTWRAVIASLLNVAGRTEEQVRADLKALAPEATGVLTLLYPTQNTLDLMRSDREAFCDAMASSIEQVLWNMARQQKVALFLDDFQLAEPASASFLDRFSRAMRSNPVGIAILVASRPPTDEEPHIKRALARARERSELLKMSRMSDRDIGKLVEGMCPVPCDPSVLHFVASTSGGNPLFAIHTCRHLASTGALRIADGYVRLVEGADKGIPPALMDLISARLEALRRQARDGALLLDIITRVAVLGRFATTDSLFAMCKMEGRHDLADTLDPLVDHLVIEGFLRRVLWTDSEHLVLEHPLMADAVLAHAGNNGIARLHLYAAQLIEKMHADAPLSVARDLAEHYFAAGFWDRATDFLLIAGDSMREEARLREARQAFLKAEECIKRLDLPDDPRRVRILLSLAELLFLAGELHEARQRLEQLLVGKKGTDLCEDHLRALELRARIEEALREYDSARDTLGGLVKLCLASNDRHRAAAAMLKQAELHLVQGENAEAHALTESAEGLVRADGDTRTMGLVHLMYGKVMRKMGSSNEAFEHFERAIALLVDPRDFAERAEALYFKGAKLSESERVSEAVEVFREGVRLCEQTGFARGLAAHLSNLGSELICIGRLEEGHDAILRALAIRERMGDSVGVAQCVTALAHYALARQDFENARDLSQKAIRLNHQAGYVLGERVACLNLAKAFLGLGRKEDAKEALKVCISTAARDRAVTPPLAYAHQMWADILEAEGNAAEALRHRLNAVAILEKLELFEKAEALRQQIIDKSGA